MNEQASAWMNAVDGLPEPDAGVKASCNDVRQGVVDADVDLDLRVRCHEPREARLQRFMGFLQHDPLRVITARRWWEEEKWNDRLISMGALQEEEISTIYARRQAYGDAPAG